MFMKIIKLCSILFLFLLSIMPNTGCYSDEEYPTQQVIVTYSGASVGQYLYVACWKSPEGMGRTLNYGDEPDSYVSTRLTSSSGSKYFRLDVPANLIFLGTYIGDSSGRIYYGNQCEVYNDLDPSYYRYATPIIVNREDNTIYITIDHTL